VGAGAAGVFHLFGLRKIDSIRGDFNKGNMYKNVLFSQEIVTQGD
jgi:hypothetical protein